MLCLYIEALNVKRIMASTDEVRSVRKSVAACQGSSPTNSQARLSVDQGETRK